MSQSSLLKSALQELRDRPDQLIEIILRQAEQIELMGNEIDELKKQIRDLNDRNNGLSSKVEQLEKAAARQAAPFEHRSSAPRSQSQKTGPQGGPSGLLPQSPRSHR
jgi:uncharacterized coiled-coil DUF342 family protein